MKIILLSLVFGIISSATVPVVNVWYNYDYSLLKDYSSSYSEYYFRAEVFSSDTMDIELNVTKGTFNNDYFIVTVLDYNHYPSDKEIMEQTGTSIVKRPEGWVNKEYEGYGYWVVTFPYESTNRYLGIIVSYIPGYYVEFSYLHFKVDITKYKYSEIQDLDYNQYYYFYTGRFQYNIMPENYQIYIRIKVHSDDKMEIRLRTDVTYDRERDFQVDVCQYKNQPVESQVYYGTGSERCDNLTNFSEENRKYNYSFSTELDVEYLSIRIINNITDRELGRSLKQLDIYIYSEKGMAIAILVTIIVVPIIVVGVIVYFVLRKFGYCRTSS